MLEMRELSVTSIIVRILTSIILGGAIGLDRGMKNRPAGFRTYMLVSIGSCVVMLINQYVYQVYETGDPMRLGAQVISGIGFLGAGTIILTGHNQIKGLTTAAGLWASACIGLAIGIGLYEVGIAASVAVFTVLTMLQRLDFRMRSKTRIVDVYVELEDSVSLGSFLYMAREKNLELSNIQREEDAASACENHNFVVTIRGKSPMHADEIIWTVRKIAGVKYAEML